MLRVLLLIVFSLELAPIQAVADTISRYFVPSVIVIALLTFVIWITLAETDSLPPYYYGVCKVEQCHYKKK